MTIFVRFIIIHLTRKIIKTKTEIESDVDFEKAEPIVEAITPVPGGVGSVTTSVLVGHVVEAAKRKFA